MNRLSLRFVAVLLALGTLAVLTPAASTCPFCSANLGPTLVEDFDQTAFVILGKFTNPKADPKAGLAGGTTDFVIEKALKNHEYLKGKKVINLPKLVRDETSTYVVYCDIYKGTLDPFKGVATSPTGDLVKYLTKALTLKDALPGDRLRHCFDFLTSGELDVSTDAYREFAKADYNDYKEMAKKLPANVLAGWIEDPKTPPYRLGLYASLLGHCGDPEKHGKLLRTAIEDPNKQEGIDGMLASYVMLQPKEGWSYLRNVLSDAKQSFQMRYAALRTLRFFYDQRADLLKRDQVVEGLALTLKHGDMADFSIEDLRRWKRWELSDQVLDLFGKDTHNVPVIRRAILRYALQCPEKRAVAFVQDLRRRDPEYVQDAEELLRQETPAEEPVQKKK